jgi:hypothetical protein
VFPGTNRATLLLQAVALVQCKQSLAISRRLCVTPLPVCPKDLQPPSPRSISYERTRVACRDWYFEIGSLLPNTQRQPRTCPTHCATYCTLCRPLLQGSVGHQHRIKLVNKLPDLTPQIRTAGTCSRVLLSDLKSNPVSCEL